MTDEFEGFNEEEEEERAGRRPKQKKRQPVRFERPMTFPDTPAGREAEEKFRDFYDKTIERQKAEDKDRRLAREVITKIQNGPPLTGAGSSSGVGPKKERRKVEIGKIVKITAAVPVGVGAGLSVVLGRLFKFALQKPWQKIRDFLNEFTFGQFSPDDKDGSGKKGH